MSVDSSFHGVQMQEAPRGAACQLMEERWQAANRLHADEITRATERIEAEIRRVVQSGVQEVETAILQVEALLERSR